MLEKVILLLRNVLDQHPSPYPSRSDTLRNLCLALLVRFNQWGWAVDAYEVKNLTADCIESFVLESREGVSSWLSRGPSHTVQDNTTARVQSAGDVELECHSETAHLALSLLNEFRRSVKHSSIDTAILTYRMVLDLRPPTTPNRALTLFELAESLVTRFHLTDQREDLDEAIALFKEATHVVHPAPDPEQYRCLLSLGMAFELRFHRYEDLDLDDDLAAIQAMEQAADEDNEAMDLSQTGSDQLEAFEQSGMNSILDTAITRLSRSLLLRPAQHPLRAMSLNNLAIALSRRFEQTGHPADLEEAISLQREALNLHVAPHPNRCMYLNNLAAAFHTRFEQSGYLPDLEEAVDVHREALELRPCLHPDRFMSLHNLADALLERFKQKLYLPDLENAITLHREELELCPAPHPGRSMALDSLASALYTQFQQKDHLPDLDEAVVLHREGLSLRSTTHPGRFMQLNNFASALHAQFEQRGRLPDLEEAVALHREALSLCPPAHPCRSMSLNNLGIALSTRFEHHGHLPDLEEAISLHREELDLCPPPHPSRFKPLNNLARDLRTRFAQTGHPADLEEAISFQREALQLHPASHSDHSGSLSNLAGAVLQRFVQTGHLPDLDETIYLHRKALDLRPAPHPDRSMSLSDLARALVRRFEQKGHLPDLEEAIVLHRAALELRAATHPNHFISLNNLATTLCIRYEQMGQIPDLQEAIAWLRKALDLCHTSHPDRPTLLNNLASALDTQLERKGNLTDSEEAIALHREVLSLRPVPHPNRSISLNNLATALFTRFQQTGHLGDLTETIVLYQQSLDLLPVGDPNHCGATNLGIALIALHRDSVPEQQEHLEQAMAAFHHGALCKTAPLREQFRSSREWSRHAGIWHHTSALEAFQHTIDLLPHLSSLDMNLQARQEVLAQTSGIASEACNWAIHAGHLEKAVEFLSAARVVFWSQALHLRTPLDNLQSVSPHCAGRLRAIAAELEYTSQWNVDVSYIGHDKVQDTEKKASHRRDLNEERIRILNEVRKLPGFQDFMLPKSFDDLSSILNGPVVMLSVSMEGCDGILLTHGKVRVKHIPFLDLTPEHMLKIGDLTRAALSKTRLGIPNTLKDLSRILNEQMRGDHSRKMVRVPEPGCTSDDLFRFVLEVLWLTVACPVIDALNLTVRNYLLLNVNIF